MCECECRRSFLRVSRVFRCFFISYVYMYKFIYLCFVSPLFSAKALHTQLYSRGYFVYINSHTTPFLCFNCHVFAPQHACSTTLPHLQCRNVACNAYVNFAAVTVRKEGSRVRCYIFVKYKTRHGLGLGRNEIGKLKMKAQASKK